MKNNTPNGPLFPPELKEALARLKRKEPEIEAIVRKGGTHVQEDDDRARSPEETGDLRGPTETVGVDE